MICTLVKSAFQTGYFSVASEGLIRQVLVGKGYQLRDLEALNALCEALNNGQIQREACVGSADVISLDLTQALPH